MIDRDGVEYPDPPTDPVERAKWKTIHFAQNYGMGKKRLDEMLRQMKAQQQYDRRVRIHRRLVYITWVIAVVSFLIAIYSSHIIAYYCFVFIFLISRLVTLFPPRMP